jgi:hypothetical protein
MRWDLMILAASVVITLMSSAMSHHVSTSAGLSPKRLTLSVATAALINLFVVVIYYGINSSWLGATSILFGGVLFGLLFIRATGMAGLQSFTTLIARLQLVLLPLSSLMLWLKM